MARGRLRSAFCARHNVLTMDRVRVWRSSKSTLLFGSRCARGAVFACDERARIERIVIDGRRLLLQPADLRNEMWAIR